MTGQTVGRVYAEGLFLLAQEEHCEKQVCRELGGIADAAAENPEFPELLSVPTLDVGERIGILRAVIGEGTGIMENFLCLLVEKRRFRNIEEIRREYDKLYQEAFGIAEVFVTTAVALDDRQRGELRAVLGKKLGKEIELHETVDAAILGGMIVQYGDTRMDNSIRTRMVQFRQSNQ